MKKMFLSVALVGTLTQAVNLEYLSGDSKLACEAMLCLASPVQPSECSASLARYFGIHFKKPWKTVNARKAFLNLCPVESQDSEMLKYKNEILANLDGDCSVETLNQRVEKKLLRVEKICESGGAGNGALCRDIKIYGYRTDPNLTHSCYLLSNSAYTDYHLKYTCDNKFYEEKDWNSGFVEINGAKEEIKKQCWVNE